jgi:hypothetical protein
MPLVDSDGRPAIEPRSNFGYARGVYMLQWYTAALHAQSTTASLPLGALTARARDAGKLHQKCREVASPARVDFRRPTMRATARATAGPCPPKRPRPSRASVGLMEHRT